MVIDLELKEVQDNSFNNLKKILWDNRNTEIGKKYQFSEIETFEQYCNKVPLSTYQTYEESLQRMMNGENNILTSYPLSGFVTTSGTTGKIKYLPFSKETENRLYRLHLLQNKLLEEVEGKCLMVTTFQLDPKKDDKQIGLASAFIYRSLLQNHLLYPERYAGGIDSFFGEGMDFLRNQMYIKSWIALLSEDLIMMEAIFRYEFLMFFGYLKYHWKEVLEDIRNKNIPYEKVKDAKIREILLKMPVDNKRLNTIMLECSKGFENIAKRLWPNLRLMSGIAMNSLTETMHIKYYTGDIDSAYFCFGASEGIIGVSFRVNDLSYLTISESGLIEYMPLDQFESSPKTLLGKDVKIGECYEIILTNFSGLYRYRLNDIVKIKDKIGDCPVIEFQYRQGYMLNVMGEKITGEQINQVIYNVSRETGISISDYIVMVKVTEERYQFVLSLDSDDIQCDKEKIKRKLDKQMMKVNHDYSDLRIQGYFKPAKALFLEEKQFQEFMEDNQWPRGNGKPKHLVFEEIDEGIWKKWAK